MMGCFGTMDDMGDFKVCFDYVYLLRLRSTHRSKVTTLHHSSIEEPGYLGYKLDLISSYKLDFVSLNLEKFHSLCQRIIDNPKL